MYSAKKSGYALIQVVISLTVVVMVLMISSIKGEMVRYEIRDSSDKIATMIRSSHQDYRATRDISIGVRIQYKDTITTVEKIKAMKVIEKFEIPKSLSLMWANVNDNEQEESGNSYGVTLRFRNEGVYSTSNNGKGLTIYLKDKKSSKYIKLTIVPSSGRVYMYDNT